MTRTWMKKTCCELCPFSKTKTLWLHPERAEEFASMAGNPFSDFPCHKTADLQEDTEYSDGGYVHGERSFTCHGFKTLQASECGDAEDEFTPDGDGFDDYWEMLDRHQERYDKHDRPPLLMKGGLYI